MFREAQAWLHLGVVQLLKCCPKEPWSFLPTGKLDRMLGGLEEHRAATYAGEG